MSSSTSCSHGDEACYFCSAARTKQCCSCRACNRGSYPVCHDCASLAFCHLCRGQDLDIRTDSELRSSKSLTLDSDGTETCHCCFTARTTQCCTCPRCNQGSHPVCKDCISLAFCHLCGGRYGHPGTDSDIRSNDSPSPVSNGNDDLKNLYEVSKVVVPLEFDIARKVGERSRQRLCKNIREIKPYLRFFNRAQTYKVCFAAFEAELGTMLQELGACLCELADLLNYDECVWEVWEDSELSEVSEHSDNNSPELQDSLYRKVFASSSQNASHLLEAALQPLSRELAVTLSRQTLCAPADVDEYDASTCWKFIADGIFSEEEADSYGEHQERHCT